MRQSPLTFFPSFLLPGLTFFSSFLLPGLLSNDVHQLDPLTLTWSFLQVSGAPPSPRFQHSFVSANNCILFVFGGSTSSSSGKSVVLKSGYRIYCKTTKQTRDRSYIVRAQGYDSQRGRRDRGRVKCRSPKHPRATRHAGSMIGGKKNCLREHGHAGCSERLGKRSHAGWRLTHLLKMGTRWGVCCPRCRSQGLS